jgi:hypothetical protein
MRANVKKVLRRVKRWPLEDQDELGRLALEIEARRRHAVPAPIVGEQIPGQQLLCQQLEGQQALGGGVLNEQFLAGPAPREATENRPPEATATEHATAAEAPAEIRRPDGPLVAETHGEVASDADVAATRSRYAIISAA